jgi:tetratricopeptide (TPR) repeat protein
MPILSAENQFKKGLTALVDHNYQDATVFFKRAIDIDLARNRRKPDLRYLSYYGLSLAKAGISTVEAISICRQAVSRHKSHPVLWLNLGRVYVLAGKRDRALEALDAAMKLAPGNRVLAQELAQLERRSSPVLRMLPRSHPVNIALGKLRRSMRRSSRSESRVRTTVSISR